MSMPEEEVFVPYDLRSRLANVNRYFPGRRAIVHRPKNPTAADVECYGHRGAIDKARLSLYGGTLSIEDLSCTWEVWGYTRAVNNGDELIDVETGKGYVVMGRFFSEMTSRYECVCQEIEAI